MAHLLKNEMITLDRQYDMFVCNKCGRRMILPRRTCPRCGSEAWDFHYHVRHFIISRLLMPAVTAFVVSAATLIFRK